MHESKWDEEPDNDRDRQSSMLQASWHAILKAFGLLKSLNFFISDPLERWQVFESIGAAGQKRWHVPIHWFLIKFGLNIIERSFPHDKRLSGEVAWSPIHARYVCEGFRYQFCWIFFCRSTGHVRFTEVCCGSACPQRRRRCTGTSWRQDKMWREAEFRITCTDDDKQKKTLSKFREGQIFRGYCRTLFCWWMISRELPSAATTIPTRTTHPQIQGRYAVSAWCVLKV